jgi:hypothetical protein
MNYSNIKKIKWHRFIYFYTIWAFVLHILYYKGVIGNTFPIALFVFVCSQIIAIVNPIHTYVIPFEIVFHFIPLLLIPVSFEHTEYLVYTFLLYLIFSNTKSFSVYIDPINFLVKK